MSQVPLVPRLKTYRGSKPDLRRKCAEQNARAQRIVDHINRLIANDPAEMQQYLWGFVALDLGVTPEQVGDAVTGGGHNGISIRVTDADRAALERYK